MIRKGGSNWVDGDNFFDRENDLEARGEGDLVCLALNIMRMEGLVPC